MENKNNQIGTSILALFDKNGAPWGVGTISIILALSVRLIHLSTTMSGYIGYEEKIKYFLNLCDEDDRIFQGYLNGEVKSLNIVPKEIMIEIIPLLNELTMEHFDIKENVRIDFLIGREMLYRCAEQTLRIIENNNYEGVQRKDFLLWERKLNKLGKFISKESAENNK